jgi:GNAT superfamily N-acetyltransferase
VSEPLSERVWVMRDAPRRRGDCRSAEVVAAGVPVAGLDALAREEMRGAFRVCYLLPRGEADTEVRAAFKCLRYRLMATEELMVHRLAAIAPAAEPFPVSRVTAAAEADALAKAAGRRQILPEHLTAAPSPVRQYAAWDGESPVGRVNSVVVGDRTWCASMFVEPGYRRRGIARSLLTRMLRDDHDAGSAANVLLASHAGSKLYPTVGYETLGTLYMYVPPRPAA